MAETNDTFTGIWECRYWYPSNDHDGEDISEYRAKVHQLGNKLIVESLPTDNGAYMILSLTIDDDLATGVWQENTAPEGSFKGTIYSGAVQLLMSADRNSFEGKWVGIGQDDGKRQIYTGRWQLVRSKE